jgi:2-furoyl-CoA dehydrogenase large subunit
MTNKTPSGMVRGFGGPQIYYGLERLMQRVAVELKLDPLDVIRRNLIPAGSFPYRAAAGALIESGDYQTAVATAIAEGKLDELKRRREQARADGRLYGIGFAVVVEPAQSNMGYLSTINTLEERRKAGPKGGNVAYATVSVDALGGVSVTADSLPQGQGHMTVLSQIVADELGLEPRDIVCNMERDTQRDPWSIATGNYSSRFSSSTAVAAQLAARKVRDKVARIAAHILDAPLESIGFADGKVYSDLDPSKALRFSRVAGTAHWSPSELPPGVEPGLTEIGVWSPPELEPPNDADQINTSLTYGFVFDFCGLEVDRDTGDVRIDRYVTMHDSGKLLNPLIADGQVYGGFAWGVGAALREQFVYDDDGSFLSGTFADYLCPTACEVPEPLILHMETPSPLTPLGAKGIGEGNVMSTPVCIANAVADAIDARDLRLPLTPAKLAAMIQGPEPARPKAAAAAPAPAPVAKAEGRGLRGQGSALVPSSPEVVWRTLLDPDKLAKVIPGCRSMQLTGPNTYLANLSLGVGAVRGRFEARVGLTDLVPPKAAVISGALQGPLGSSSGRGNIQLEPEGGGTRLRYDYQVEISGKVAAVGGRMLDGAARVLMNQFFQRLAGLATAPVEAPVSAPQASAATAVPASAPQRSWWQRLLAFLGIGT